MAIASLLTLLALAGVIAGWSVGEKRRFSAHLSAAGGGLLLGLALFWIIPEIAHESDWMVAVLSSATGCLALALLDRRVQHHEGEPGEQLIWPVLGATAVHSFLDGWSVRALGGEPAAGAAVVAVPIGLAFHKLPEGFAIGWITRRSLGSRPRAFVAGAAVELFTMVGAFVEPTVSYSGTQRFGSWWTIAVLAIIAGSFSFLGLHTVLPERRNAGVLVVFFGTLAAAGGVAAVRL